MDYQVDYQWARLRGCVTEQNCNARGRNRAVIGEGVSKLSEGMCLIYFDMMLRCWNQGWTDWPVQCFSKYWWHKIKCTLTWIGQKLYTAGFRIPTVWFETYKDPFLCKLRNFIRTNLQGIHQIQKRKSLNKGGALAPLSNTDWGHNKGLFSRTILWLTLGSPSLRGRLAKRGKLQQQPSETKLHLSHFKKLPTYTSPPTSREMAAIWGGFHSACSATGLCLMRGSLFDINYWIESAAQEGCQCVHHCASSNSLSQRWIIRGFIQDKTKDAVMIKRNWNWQNFICFFVVFFLLRRRKDGWRYMIIPLCLIILMQLQTNVSVHYFSFTSISGLHLYWWTQKTHNCSGMQQ